MILNASPGCGLNFPKNSITLKNMINKIIKEGQPTPGLRECGCPSEISIYRTYFKSLLFNGNIFFLRYRRFCFLLGNHQF